MDASLEASAPVRDVRAQCEELRGRVVGGVIGGYFLYTITSFWQRTFESPTRSNRSFGWSTELKRSSFGELLARV
jgi:hypothetical protein